MAWKAFAAAFAACLIAGVVAYATLRVSPGTPDTPPIQLNHVGISVANLDQAVEFYTKKMGYRRAFAIPDAPGQPRAVYLQVSRETFVELLEATPARPPGFVHVGFEVDDINAAAARLTQANVKVAPPRVGRSKATVAEVEVPDGVNVELLQFGPESMQLKAIEAWTR
jgi:catechol 2,3-dioxygenase-like lactoylglutathione lyase family enzyme